MTTVVLLPGLGADAALWDPCQKMLSSGGCPAVSVDYQSTDSIVAMAAQVLSSVSGEIIPVGLSMGGYVALEILRQAPERVKALGLCCTTIKADSDQRVQQRLQELEAGEVSYTEKRQTDEHFQAYLSEVNHNRTELIRVMRAMDQRSGYGTFKRHNIACIHRVDSTELFKNFNLPSLILAGRDDPLFSVELQIEQFKIARNAKLAILPACGHVASLEQTAAVAAELDQLYRRQNQI